MPAKRLSVAVVTYRTPKATLEAALRSLGRAVREARAAGLAGETAVHVVDNGPAGERDEVVGALAAWPPEANQ